MLKNVLSSFTKEEAKNSPKISRQHSRRSGDKCVSLIDGKMYPIENWSAGGMLINADERLFAIDQDCTITLKFKLREEMLDVTHKGKVIRKNDGKVAINFAPPSKKVSDSFQQVVDDFVSRNFIDSQIES